VAGLDLNCACNPEYFSLQAGLLLQLAFLLKYKCWFGVLGLMVLCHQNHLKCHHRIDLVGQKYQIDRFPVEIIIQDVVHVARPQ